MFGRQRLALQPPAGSFKLPRSHPRPGNVLGSGRWLQRLGRYVVSRRTRGGSVDAQRRLVRAKAAKPRRPPGLFGFRTSRVARDPRDRCPVNLQSGSKAPLASLVRLRSPRRLSIVPLGMGTRAHLRTLLFAVVLLTLCAAPPAVAGSELSES